MNFERKLLLKFRLYFKTLIGLYCQRYFNPASVSLEGHQSVLAWRNISQSKRSIIACYGVVWIVYDLYPSKHPTVCVTVNFNCASTLEVFLDYLALIWKSHVERSTFALFPKLFTKVTMSVVEYRVRVQYIYFTFTNYLYIRGKSTVFLI